jgi:tetratricopeptide (TPR) repeat protein
MVMSYLLQKQPQQAVQFLQEQISSRPTEAFLYHTLPEIFRLNRNREQAITNYNKALRINPDAIGSVISLAKIYLEEGKTDEAVQMLQAASRRNPQNVGLAVSTAVALDTAKRWQEAQKEYERALALDGANTVALNNLAWLLAEHGGNIDVALKLAQQAKEQRADDVQVTNTIGWIYYKKNSFQMALQYLGESAAKARSNPIYHYQLGLTYWKLGRGDEARQALQAALRLNPSFPEADAARKLLQEL